MCSQNMCLSEQRLSLLVLQRRTRVTGKLSDLHLIIGEPGPKPWSTSWPSFSFSHGSCVVGILLFPTKLRSEKNLSVIITEKMAVEFYLSTWGGTWNVCWCEEIFAQLECLWDALLITEDLPSLVRCLVLISFCINSTFFSDNFSSTFMCILNILKLYSKYTEGGKIPKCLIRKTLFISVRLVMRWRHIVDKHSWKTVLTTFTQLQMCSIFLNYVKQKVQLEEWALSWNRRRKLPSSLNKALTQSNGHFCRITPPRHQQNQISIPVPAVNRRQMYLPDLSGLL